MWVKSCWYDVNFVALFTVPNLFTVSGGKITDKTKEMLNDIIVRASDCEALASMALPSYTVEVAIIEQICVKFDVGKLY